MAEGQRREDGKRSLTGWCAGTAFEQRQAVLAAQQCKLVAQYGKPQSSGSATAR